MRYFHSMDCPIDLNNEFPFKATEVDDEWSNWSLSSEFESMKAMCSKFVPQNFLSRSLPLSKRTCLFQCFATYWNTNSTHKEGIVFFLWKNFYFLLQYALHLPSPSRGRDRERVYLLVKQPSTYLICLQIISAISPRVMSCDASVRLGAFSPSASITVMYWSYQGSVTGPRDIL